MRVFIDNILQYRYPAAVGIIIQCGNRLVVFMKIWKYMITSRYDEKDHIKMGVGVREIYTRPLETVGR